jgi:hypothetical protein
MVQEAEDDESDDAVPELEPVPPPRSTSDSTCGPSAGSNAALFGFRALAYSLRQYHPTLPQAVNLFAVFTENVSPVIHPFHMPTLSKSYWDAIASLDSVDKNTEALLFAIYYSAAISLPGDEQCLSLLGQTRAAATERFRFGVEQALARADLLNTHSTVLLQAAVLFLSALRNQDDTRTTWSLTALVFYVAQSMGLHRDGAVFGLGPFETEVRRRLWWYICMLDGHSSRYQEYEANVHKFFSDTKLPLHINDCDMWPGMAEAPPEREGWTDMTFCLVRCEAINTASTTKLVGPRLQKGPTRLGGGERGGSAEPSADERRQIVEGFVERVTERYLRHCDPSEPVALMTAMVIRLIFSRFWLLVYRPQPGPGGSSSSSNSSSDSQHCHSTRPASTDTHGGQGGSTTSTCTGNNNNTTPGAPGQDPTKAAIDQQTRDKLFAISTDILELSTGILTHHQLVRFSWYSKTYVQWHAVGYVLAEICCRPSSPECDRAWDAVRGVYESGILREGGADESVSGGNSSTRGAGGHGVWKPIRRLMAKARYVRGVQRGGGRGGVKDLDTPSPSAQDGGNLHVLYGGPAGTTTGSHISPSSSIHNPGLEPPGTSVLGFASSGSGDSLMDMLDFPGDLGGGADDLARLGFQEGNNGFALDMMGAGSAMDGWDGRMW